MAQHPRIALVTGANRGIGLQVCKELGSKGLRVILTARDAKAGQSAAVKLAADGSDVRFELLDVSDKASIEACAERLQRAGEHIDVLINNGAVWHQVGILSMSEETLRETLDVNLLGAIWMCRAFVPAMQKAGYGRVVNVSSSSGAFAQGLSGPSAYSMTKAALNALTVKLAAEVRGDVKINSVDPGWVRTRMGGAGASRSVEQGADTVVWLSTLPADGPTGGFFRDRQRTEW